jgi:hypothetical protein
MAQGIVYFFKVIHVDHNKSPGFLSPIGSPEVFGGFIGGGRFFKAQPGQRVDKLVKNVKISNAG